MVEGFTFDGVMTDADALEEFVEEHDRRVACVLHLPHGPRRHPISSRHPGRGSRACRDAASSMPLFPIVPCQHQLPHPDGAERSRMQGAIRGTGASLPRSELERLPEREFRDVAASPSTANRVTSSIAASDAMMVFERDGTCPLVAKPVRPRARLHIDSDDTLYCTDDGDHRVRKITRRQGAADHRRAQPTRAVHRRQAVQPLHPYVSPRARSTCDGRKPRPQILARRQASDAGDDGYRSRRIQHHNIVTKTRMAGFMSDRENHRVQVFDSSGKYEMQWNNMHRPCALLLRGQASAIHH